MLILYDEDTDNFLIYFYDQNNRLYFDSMIGGYEWTRSESYYASMHQVRTKRPQFGWEIIHDDGEY